jgi:16S rRNA (uracil1498-N3)-methyltransferase
MGWPLKQTWRSPVSARFYSPDPPQAGRYRLVGDEARHLSQVCRFKIGDEVELFDGHGLSIPAKVAALSRNVAELIAIGDARHESPSLIDLTLAVAVPKGERLDWLVEKATELGTRRLVPIQAQRSVVEPRASKLDRLRRTVIEASKQCGRNRLMEIAPLAPFHQVIDDQRDELRLIAHPGGLSSREWPRIVEGSRVALAIGPEGGFTDVEVESAIKAGWVPVSLGSHLLRIETAGIVGLAAILARTIAADSDQAVH